MKAGMLSKVTDLVILMSRQNQKKTTLLETSILSQMKSKIFQTRLVPLMTQKVQKNLKICQFNTMICLLKIKFSSRSNKMISIRKKLNSAILKMMLRKSLRVQNHNCLKLSKKTITLKIGPLGSFVHKISRATQQNRLSLNSAKQNCSSPPPPVKLNKNQIVN